jgi:cyclophilin family peptidyl-prolyl cis-trans isomerase
LTDRRQRQKQLRAEKRQEERRRASRRELRRRLIIALGVGLSLAAVFLVSGVLANRPAGLPASYLAFRAKPVACGGQLPPEERLMSFDQPATLGLTGQLTAEITTSCGAIVIALDPSFEQTVNSFVFLARQGFYDGTVIHRIASDLVIQAGDPLAEGRGGPGYFIPDEFPPSGFVYQPGVVAMANAGGGTTGSQFFIVIGDKARVFNPTFNVLGEVVSGLETIDAIAAVPTALQPGSNERSLPLEAVYLEKIEVTQG